MIRGTLATLRDVVPLRPLTQSEAYRIAELQAGRLLKLAGVTEPPVPNSAILDVPKIQVRYIKPWPVSGCTDWTGSMWTIAINASEPAVRQPPVSFSDSAAAANGDADCSSVAREAWFPSATVVRWRKKPPPLTLGL